MPGFENARSEPSNEQIEGKPDRQLDRAPKASDPVCMDTGSDTAAAEPPVEWETISARMERFSNLSSDMIAMISGLSREAKKAMDQLHAIRAAVDLKKEELNTLHDKEESAAELQRLIEVRRLQIANLEQLLERQRNAFETEKSEREQEERKYREDLKVQRKREEEEYKETRAAEELQARQSLKDELQALRQESAEKQEELNRHLLEREQRIGRQEKELDLLTQELEQFMSRLAKRAHSEAPDQDDPPDSGTSMVRDI